MKKVEYYKRLFSNPECDMKEAILSLLQDIGYEYGMASQGDQLRTSVNGIERDYYEPVYSMGCHVDNYFQTEVISWETILDEFWNSEQE